MLIAGWGHGHNPPINQLARADVAQRQQILSGNRFHSPSAEPHPSHHLNFRIKDLFDPLLNGVQEFLEAHFFT
ncbi:hypothetical protein [Candidatus Amarolinea dominans]|uniref:hypothetical protein n=1 Tax=Candidatus Amarolinea dominans TaxID=3140696 RepID=UPI001D4A887C|nr:hypothetical protein [Anaerolineae bacterium]